MIVFTSKPRYPCPDPFALTINKARAANCNKQGLRHLRNMLYLNSIIYLNDNFILFLISFPENASGNNDRRRS